MPRKKRTRSGTVGTFYRWSLARKNKENRKLGDEAEKRRRRNGLVLEPARITNDSPRTVTRTLHNAYHPKPHPEAID